MLNVDSLTEEDCTEYFYLDNYSLEDIKRYFKQCIDYEKTKTHTMWEPLIVPFEDLPLLMNKEYFMNLLCGV